MSLLCGCLGIGCVSKLTFPALKAVVSTLCYDCGCSIWRSGSCLDIVGCRLAAFGAQGTVTMLQVVVGRWSPIKDHFARILRAGGFEQSTAEKCLFMHRRLK
eukprot:4713613-Amphidinium_carterae.1